MTKQDILDQIAESITSNGLQKINGVILNTILTAIAEIIPDENMLTSSFGGVVTPSSNLVVTPGQQKWFFASVGKYPQADNLILYDNFINILSYDGASWSPYSIPVVSKYDEIIGTYPEIGKVNLMTLPYSGFNINLGNNELPSTLRYGQPDSILKDRYLIKIRAKMRSLGTANIFVYKKSDNSLVNTIQINATSEYYEHTFITPIDLNEFRILFNSKFMYYAVNGSVPVIQYDPVGNIMGTNNTIALSVEYYTYRDIVVPAAKTISERLDYLENDEDSEDMKKSFKWSNLMMAGNDLINRTGKENINSIYSFTNGELTISTIGQGMGCIVGTNVYLNKRSFEFDVKLKSTDTVVYTGTVPFENQTGATNYTINFGTRKIQGTYDIPSDFEINTNDVYSISLSTNEKMTSVRVRNNRTMKEYSTPEFQHEGQFDRYKVGFVSGQGGIISNMKIMSLTKEQPYIIFFGDSITRGYNLADLSQRFTDLIGTKLQKPFLISGRAAGNINGLLSRVQTEVPTLRPRYVCITIGTNGQNTEANLNQLVDFCESYGCEVILNRVPLYDGNTAGTNATIAKVVSDRKLKSIRFDIATSVNFDGVTKDNSCFTNESNIFIHPNEKGNRQMYERARYDIEDVFINAGVGV